MLNKALGIYFPRTLFINHETRTDYCVFIQALDTTIGRRLLYKSGNLKSAVILGNLNFNPSIVWPKSALHWVVIHLTSEHPTCNNMNNSSGLLLVIFLHPFPFIMPIHVKNLLTPSFSQTRWIYSNDIPSFLHLHLLSQL